MTILVINCGSSSVKADLLEAGTGARVHSRRVERLDGPAAVGEAVGAVLTELPLGGVTAVGHRVVHGGETFDAAVRIDDAIEAQIDALCPLAPLHNPANLAGIRAARARLPDIPHVAVFDTAFHATLPPRARRYALPASVVEQHGIRRYGFHGTSHHWVATQAAQWMGEPLEQLRIITLHLGNGCSATAVEYGRSVETSMGMTPLEGLVMGTRAGDVDAGVVVELMRAGMDADAIDRLMNRESGLAGLSGAGNDMRDIEARAAEGDDRCRAAIQVFAHRARKYIGAYAAVMGGVDAIVFTAGIGQNSALIRHRIGQRLGFLGAQLDEDRNRDARVDAAHPVFEISQPRSRVKLLCVQTDEALAIARAADAMAHDADAVGAGTIPVAISARHIHLTQEAVEALFGEGHQLTPYKPLSQPGQFACEEKLNLIGPKRRIDGVRVLGPVRPACQIEVSRTDEFALGIDAPVRNSGDVKNSPGITLEGPNGTLSLTEGLICARRHIHMTPEDAERFGVEDKDVVDVAIDSDGRDLVFGDVLIRVKSTYTLEMHIDTDEANAAEITRGHEGMLVDTGVVARLTRRKVQG
jgi:acetate kinase